MEFVCVCVRVWGKGGRGGKVRGISMLLVYTTVVVSDL